MITDAHLRQRLRLSPISAHISVLHPESGSPMTDTLTRSKDRKVTNGVSPNGKVATIANSFGLPAGKAFSCPGQTSVCERVCYAGKLEKIYKGVKAILVRNFEMLQGKTTGEMCFLLSMMIQEFVADCEKRGAEKKFRIHWDGDFFSADYTKAWANTIRMYPDVQFWVYTRSFEFVPLLSDLPNLTTYLSVDSDNIAKAIVCRKANPFVRWAWLADTFAEGREQMPVTESKVYPCPENAKRIPLISEKGSACVRCGICVDGRGDVLFAVKKR
jgi:hypothetical protein